MLVAANRAVVGRLLEGHARIGIPDVRPKHGFVIRAVGAEQPTVGRLAELLETSKQAASKLADAMVRDGFLERFTDERDRRSTRLKLAAKGARVRKRAIELSARMEAELTAEVGAAEVRTFRKVLTRLLAQHGALDEVQARRARPVWMGA